MIVFSRIVPPFELGMEVYNMTSFYEGFYRLKLIPPFSIFDDSTNQLDIAYANWLFGCPEACLDLMNLLNRVYQGARICILTSEDYKYDMIVESLEKFISNRYGLIPNYVNYYEDFECLEDSAPRNVTEIANFDADMQYFLSSIINSDPTKLYSYRPEMLKGDD